MTQTFTPTFTTGPITTWADLDAFAALTAAETVHPLKTAMLEARDNQEAAWKDHAEVVDMMLEGKASLADAQIVRIRAEACERAYAAAWDAWDAESARTLGEDYYQTVDGLMGGDYEGEILY